MARDTGLQVFQAACASQFPDGEDGDMQRAYGTYPKLPSLLVAKPNFALV